MKYEPWSTVIVRFVTKHVVSSTSDYSVANFSTTTLDDDTSAGMTGVTREELEQLKQDAVICVNESLFKKLQQIEQVRGLCLGW